MKTLSINGKFIYTVLFFCLILKSMPCLADVNVFNDKVIGKSIEALIKLTTAIPIDGIDDELNPNRIETYIEGGNYIGAVVFYPFSKSNFQNIERALNALYKGAEQKWIGETFKYWRIDENKLAVSLTHSEPCEDKHETQEIFITYKIYR